MLVDTTVCPPGRSRRRIMVSDHPYPDIEHTPVLLAESMRFLEPMSGNTYLDATAGGGGYAGAILERSSPDGKVVLVDRDHDALEYTRKRLERFADRITILHGNFADLPQLLEEDTYFAGVAADLGFSTLQLESNRGFSFSKDEELDMRMDRGVGTGAAELVNHLSSEELADIFWKYGEERRSRRIAEVIIRRRRKGEIRTTGELAACVRKASDPRYAVKSLARVFMALRIRVNDELSSLERGLPMLLSRLAPGGTIVVVAYHSLEDRIVKRFFATAHTACVCPPGFRNPWCDGSGAEGVRLTKKVVKPTGEEKQANPRSRSSRLRAFRRPAEGGAS